MTRLVSEAHSLDALDELPIELEVQGVERCLYGIGERSAAITRSRCNLSD